MFTTTKPIRLLLAVIVPAYIGIFTILVLYFVIKDMGSFNLNSLDQWASMVTFVMQVSFVLGSTFGLATMALCGLPAHMFLHSKRITHIIPYLGFGVLAGAVASIVVSRLTLFGHATLAAFILSVAVGIMTSAIFWSIRRPDLDISSPIDSNQAT